MGNEGIYSMGKEFGKVLFHFAKQKVLWVPHEMAFLTKYSQIGQVSMTLQLLVMCFTCGRLRVALLASFSRASRKLH